MLGTIYLILFIFCGICSQGIFSAFPDENIGESSSLLVREKRVVSHMPDEDVPARINDYPYIVHIKKSSRIFCAGAILSQNVIISAAECGQSHLLDYKVISKSARTTRGISHNVTRIRLHYNNHPNRYADGISLFTVDPLIVYNRFSHNIGLHLGHLQPGAIGVVSGWGYDIHEPSHHGTFFPKELRSIEVNLMSQQECANIYGNSYLITDKDICTFHPLRHSGHNDAGAPLVVDDFLVGVFLRRGPAGNRWNVQYPDVFVFLQHPYYSEWIRNNM